MEFGQFAAQRGTVGQLAVAIGQLGQEEREEKKKRNIPGHERVIQSKQG